jgi:tRNA (cytidine/uridine-2'-O-)-methyltransferase
MMGTVFRIAFLAPQIGPNAGNAIRTAAATGCELHLIRPLGFEMSDKHLRRAGLDYHDLASVTVHESLDDAIAAWNTQANAAGTTSWGAAGTVARGHSARTTGHVTADTDRAARILAFDTQGKTSHASIDYRPGDVLLFGTETDGLPPAVLADPRVSVLARIPMLPARRSLNLANAAAIVAYEAWRQWDFRGATATRDPEVAGFA